MKTKNEIWNSFIDKKILLINPDAESVEVAVVTGCDPDIGICLNAVGDPVPHTICLGTLAPEYKKLDVEDGVVEPILENWFKMIQSGYFSYPACELFLDQLLGDDYEPVIPSCPLLNVKGDD